MTTTRKSVRDLIREGFEQAKNARSSAPAQDSLRSSKDAICKSCGFEFTMPQYESASTACPRCGSPRTTADDSSLARLAAEDARYDAMADLAEWQEMYEEGRLSSHEE